MYSSLLSTPQIAIPVTIEHTINYQDAEMTKLIKCVPDYVSSAVVDCGPLENPENGNVFVFGTTFWSFASYSCFTGYRLIGSSFRICLGSGIWSGSAPTCQCKWCFPIKESTLHSKGVI